MRCQQEAPVIEKEIWQKFKDKGLKIIALGVEENSSQASDWSYQHGLAYPVIIDPDGEIYKNYGTGSVPYHVFIDSNFKVIHSQENFEKELLISRIRSELKNLAQR